MKSKYPEIILLLAWLFLFLAYIYKLRLTYELWLIVLPLFIALASGFRLFRGLQKTKKQSQFFPSFTISKNRGKFARVIDILGYPVFFYCLSLSSNEQVSSPQSEANFLLWAIICLFALEFPIFLWSLFGGKGKLVFTSDRMICAGAHTQELTYREISGLAGEWNTKKNKKGIMVVDSHSELEFLSRPFSNIKIKLYSFQQDDLEGLQGILGRLVVNHN